MRTGWAEAASFKTLFTFNNTGSEGGVPAGSLTYWMGTLYGTTYSGYGNVFALPLSGSEYTLYSFPGQPNGFIPEGVVKLGSTLYGVTQAGGTSCIRGQGCGTLFSLSANGNEMVLYSFEILSDGSSPGGWSPSGLIAAGDSLYGTTEYGGATGNGAVFRFRNKNETILYSFKGGDDGSRPGGLIAVGRDLYGVTTGGGGSGCATGLCGTVFKVTPKGVKTVLYAFNGEQDGESPGCLLAQRDGLVGISCAGGNGGKGVVFKIKNGKLTVLYTFKGGADGANPSGLVQVGDDLYGTTLAGGDSSAGTVFRIAGDGSETVLYSFTSGARLAEPGGLISVGGNLYGTTYYGGAASTGTIWRLSLKH